MFVLLLFIYLNPNVEDVAVDLVGEKLKSIAASIAASVDGEQFNHIDLYDSASVNTHFYTDIQYTISKAKNNLELSDEDYTISLLDKNSLAFGVVLNQDKKGKNVLLPLSNEARETVERVYQNKHCEFSIIYEQKKGNVLSGFAPIYDSLKNVSGIVQVDQNFEDVNTRIDNVLSSVFIGSLIFLPLTIVFSFVTSAIFLSPIGKIKNQIMKIASGNYSESPRIKSSGEVKELVNAAENLRATILEQQKKIFENIQELKSAKNKAEASDRIKSEFLAVISHEIRTPLNVILGNIEVLKMELNEEEINELEEILGPIKIGSQRLIRTVEMLVLYSDIVSGSYNFKKEYTNVNDLFFSISEKYKKEAEQKGIQIKYDCVTNTGMIQTDINILTETITQIADNAVKFSESGSIVFCIFEKDDGKIELIVQDEGIGISKDFMKSIYKPFTQEDMSYQRPYEGNGIGLAVAKKCSDLLGMELRIESEKGKGTTAKIIIPVQNTFSIS